MGITDYLHALKLSLEVIAVCNVISILLLGIICILLIKWGRAGVSLYRDREEKTIL